MPGQLELVVQFVQGAQPDADAVLIQERHLLRVGKLDAGDIPAHPGGIQRRQQGAESLQTLIARLLFHGSGGAGRVGGTLRSGAAVCRCFLLEAQLLAGVREDRLAAIQRGQAGGLGGVRRQDLQPGREGQPALCRLHGVGRLGFRHPHDHGAGVVPLHPDVLQHGEDLFQRGGFGSGVKAEDVLFFLDTQRLQDLLAGVAARFAHHAVRRPHLNGVDLEQHGDRQIDACRDDAEQHGQRGQALDGSAASEGLAGHLPFLFSFPAGGVPQVRLRRAEPLAAGRAPGVRILRPGLPIAGPLALRRARSPLVLARRIGCPVPGGVLLLDGAASGGELDAVVRVAAGAGIPRRIAAGPGRIGVIVRVGHRVSAGRRGAGIPHIAPVRRAAGPGVPRLIVDRAALPIFLPVLGSVCHWAAPPFLWISRSVTGS